MFSLHFRHSSFRRLLVKQMRWNSKYQNGTDMTSEVKVKELISSLSIEERRLLYERLRNVLIDEEMAQTSSNGKPKSKVSSSFTKQQTIPLFCIATPSWLNCWLDQRSLCCLRKYKSTSRDLPVHSWSVFLHIILFPTSPSVGESSFK